MTGRPPPHTRRHRALTDDERALWHTVARSTKPLKPRRHAAATEKDMTDTAASPSGKATVAATASPRPVAKASVARSAPALAPLSRREKARLSRGRQEIDARLDLHGMTQSRAHRALLSFLQDARADGATFVLVITGKGRVTGSDREQGVLRRQVPLWLALPEFRTLVVGFEQAHVGHGGGGALYVRVRRS